MARTFSSGNNMSHAAAVKTAVALALLMLMKPVSAVTSGRLAQIDDGTTTNRFLLNKASTGVVQAIASSSGGAATAATTTSYSAGAWQSAHAGLASATSRRADLDGGGKGTNATSRTPSGLNATRIGTGPAETPYAGDGAEVAVLDSVPSDADVVTLCAPRNGGFIRPIMARVLGYTVLAYWPLYGAASPEPDLVGGFDMTLTGTPPQVTHPPVYDTRRILHARRMAAA